MKARHCKGPSCINLVIGAIKLALVIIPLITVQYNASAQTSQWQLSYSPSSIKAPALSPVYVGQKIPDRIIEYICENANPRLRPEVLRQKVIVIDFWQTTCGTCIGEFPKMKKLQDWFNSDIQVVLVTSEPSDLVNRKLTTWKPLIGKVPALPQIMADTILHTLFPHDYAGHYVWVDKQGVIRLKGIGSNNTEKKISALIKGEQIDFLPDSVQYGNEREFFSSPVNRKFASGFSRFSEQAHAYGEEYREEIDTVMGTARATFLNQEVLRMFMYAFDKDLNAISNDALGIISYYDPYQARVIIEKGIDPSRLGKQYARQFDDEWIRKNTFCYEQVLPLQNSADRRRWMQEDLNRFLQQELSVNAKVETRMVKCTLLKVSDAKLFSKTFGGARTSTGNKDHSFGRVISTMSWGLFEEQLLLNETGINPATATNILKLDEAFKMRDEFKAMLRQYGIALVEAERPVPMLVFYPANAKK